MRFFVCSNFLSRFRLAKTKGGVVVKFGECIPLKVQRKREICAEKFESTKRNPGKSLWIRGRRLRQRRSYR